MTYPIQKADAEWQAVLREKGAEPAAFQVTRHAATERPFTGKYETHWADGSYRCICCGAKLFGSDTKFDAGCGWPSFSRPINDNLINEKKDKSFGMNRTEVRSKTGDAHLGHVFNDGPTEKGGLRYCINSASLRFVTKEQMKAQGYEKFIPLLQKSDKSK